MRTLLPSLARYVPYQRPAARPRVEALEDRWAPALLGLPSARYSWTPSLGRAIVRPAPAPAPAERAGVAITVTGVIETGRVAIGGETTGTIIRTDDGRVYELDFRAVQRLGLRPENYNGQRVTVSGRLVVVPGVEVPDRQVIFVESVTRGGAAASQGSVTSGMTAWSFAWRV